MHENSNATTIRLFGRLKRLPHGGDLLLCFSFFLFCEDLNINLGFNAVLSRLGMGMVQINGRDDKCRKGQQDLKTTYSLV